MASPRLSGAAPTQGAQRLRNRRFVSVRRILLHVQAFSSILSCSIIGWQSPKIELPIDDEITDYGLLNKGFATRLRALDRIKHQRGEWDRFCGRLPG